MERRIELKGLKDPDGVVRLLEHTAEGAKAQGWFFVSAVSDEWMDSVTLFFEKDLEV